LKYISSIFNPKINPLIGHSKKKDNENQKKGCIIISRALILFIKIVKLIKNTINETKDNKSII